MSYCVQCGVELERSVPQCPLCQTDVLNPNEPVDLNVPSSFPYRREEVQPVSKTELALLITAMLLSTAVFVGILNIFFFYTERMWSLYIIGGVVMLWVWLVPPLQFQHMPIWCRILLDVLAIGVYVLLISVDLDGFDWYIGLALPIILTAGSIMIALSFLLKKGRSILGGTAYLIAGIGLFVVALEWHIDDWVGEGYDPTWSIVVAMICLAMIIPLVVVRRRPILREEVRRRFHL